METQLKELLKEQKFDEAFVVIATFLKENDTQIIDDNGLLKIVPIKHSHFHFAHD